MQCAEPHSFILRHGLRHRSPARGARTPAAPRPPSLPAGPGMRRAGSRGCRSPGDGSRARAARTLGVPPRPPLRAPGAGRRRGAGPAAGLLHRGTRGEPGAGPGAGACAPSHAGGQRGRAGGSGGRAGGARGPLVVGHVKAGGGITRFFLFLTPCPAG